MAHWDGAQGQAKMAIYRKNTPTCDVSPRKTQTQNEKFFSSILTTRLFAFVEGLNSSLALAAANLWPKNGAPICWHARSLKG